MAADIKVSDLAVEPSTPPPTDHLVAAETGVTNTKVPPAMVMLKSEAYSTDADKAMEVGKHYMVDISAWVSDNVFSLPTTAKVGERIGVCLTAGNDDYKLQLRTTATSNDTINGVDHDASDWSSLFITGEEIVFMCIVADTDWIVISDERVACRACYRGSMSVNSVTWTPIDLSAVSGTSIGGMEDETNDWFDVRRDNLYAIQGGVANTSFGLNDGANMLVGIDIDTGGGFSQIKPWYRHEAMDASAYVGGSTPVFTYLLSAGDKIRARSYHSQGSTQSLYPSITITEIL